MAEELREIMAGMGVRTVEEMIGRPDLLEARAAVDHAKTQGIDLARMLHSPVADPAVARWNTERQVHGLDRVFDRELIRLAAAAIDGGEPVRIDQPIGNVDRSVGATLSGEVARRYGHAGLPAGTIDLHLTGTVGQSFAPSSRTASALR